MKKPPVVLSCAITCLLLTSATYAQSIAANSSKNLPESKVDSKIVREENDSPRMFAFEPDFESQNEKRKAEIAHTRSILDTLQISERKRLRLLRDLYKNGISKRLRKALLVENNYEEFDD